MKSSNTTLLMFGVVAAFGVVMAAAVLPILEVHATGCPRESLFPENPNCPPPPNPTPPPPIPPCLHSHGKASQCNG